MWVQVLQRVPPTPYEEPSPSLYLSSPIRSFLPVRSLQELVLFLLESRSHSLASPLSHLFPKLFHESSQVFFLYRFYLRVPWDLAGLTQDNTSAKK